GQHPNVLVTIGAGAAGGADPFTCAVGTTGRRFFPEDLAQGNPSGTVNPYALTPNTNYSLSLDLTKIKTTGGEAVQPPATNASVGGQWSGGTFTMKTGGFDLMAIGYQDPGTGFFSWLDKPYKGFEKDLAPVGTDFAQP